MTRRRSFKFLDERLNRRLVDRLNAAGIEHEVDQENVIHYATDLEETVENDLIGPIRDEVFPSWRILTCPSEWIGRYRDYMKRHDIPFREELSDGELWFLLPRKYRPHSWRLESPSERARLASQTA